MRYGSIEAVGLLVAREAVAGQVTALTLMEMRREAVRALRERLAGGGARAAQAELETLARTWRLSPSNRVLLEAQRPGITLALSPAAWARLGRTPRGGETPLHLIAPARGRTVPYVAAAVLDVAQTQGARLAPAPELRGRALLVALEQAFARLAPGKRPPRGGARELLEALVRRRLAEEREVEAALRELEVSAAAFVCLRALGSRRGGAAPPLAAWRSRGGAAILVSLSRIQRAARAVLAATGALEVRVIGRPHPS
jgi:hypothetical protein